MREEFSPRLYSNRLTNTYQIRCDKHYTLWLYIEECGLWSNNAEKFIEQILRENHLPCEHMSNHHIREVISHVKSSTFKNKEFPSPLWHMIPFNNGVYDLKEKIFRKFMPTDNLAAKLTVSYNPDNQGCPLIDKIFTEFVRPEDLTDIYELAAYCMVPTYKNQEFFFILGAGRNGKSVYAHIIMSLLGKGNISAVSLHNMQSNRFAGAELHGKFANICTELQYSELKNTDFIKKLTGGDLIQAERKFMSLFKFLNHAKLIFITNELPSTMDKTPAFYRRARIILFPFSFEGRSEDKLLLEKITVQELEGLAFKCVNILQQMIKHNFTFTKTKQTPEIEQEYEVLSNPIATFIEQKCLVGDEEKYFITKDDFRKELNDWLRSTNQRIRKDKDIAQYMKERSICDEKKRIIRVGRKNCWVGIKWKE